MTAKSTGSQDIHHVSTDQTGSLLDLQAQIYAEGQACGGPVPQLMTALLDRRNLEGAWDRVRGADGALTPGVDGLTCHDFERDGKNPRAFLWELAEEIYQGHYAPAPPRWVDVPKHNGSAATRRLGILTIRDRIVHAAIKQVLEPLLEPAFYRHSFGFRPGRSVQGALDAAVQSLVADQGNSMRFPWGVQLDVADCFDTVNHALVLQALARHVGDGALLGLVENILARSGQVRRRLWGTYRHGLVQGSALSPLLCNLYLDPLDHQLNDWGGQNQDGIRVYRYADDLLILARDTKLANQAIKAVRQMLRRFSQRLREPIAAPTDMHLGVDWLGVRLRVETNPWSGKLQAGYTIPDTKVKSMLQRLADMTLPPSDKIDTQAFDLGRWIVSINDQLREWRQAYLFADNLPAVARAVDDFTSERVGALLYSVTGQRAAEVRRLYRVALPRGFASWQVKGVRLVVLSSLAPHRPRCLTRRPHWQRPARSNQAPAIVPMPASKTA